MPGLSVIPLKVDYFNIFVSLRVGAEEEEA